MKEQTKHARVESWKPTTRVVRKVISFNQKEVAVVFSHVLLLNEVPSVDQTLGAAIFQSTTFSMVDVHFESYVTKKVTVLPERQSVICDIKLVDSYKK